jgi:DNA repair ATPase RecN
MGELHLLNFFLSLTYHNRIIAVNDYALHAIESAMTKSIFVNPLVSHVFRLIPILPPRDKLAQKVVMQTFTEAMSLLSSSIQRLIVEASLSLANLDKLEERLSNIHEQVSRENSSLSSAKSELLSELWTMIGGNKHRLRGYDEHLFLLKNLSVYRKKALVHVIVALNTLQTMSEDMEDLRERVTLPVIAGSSIPVEVHMKSIKRGLERLEEGRVNAKEREYESIKRVLSISQ